MLMLSSFQRLSPPLFIPEIPILESFQNRRQWVLSSPSPRKSCEREKRALGGRECIFAILLLAPFPATIEFFPTTWLEATIQQRDKLQRCASLFRGRLSDVCDARSPLDRKNLSLCLTPRIQREKESYSRRDFIYLLSLTFNSFLFLFFFSFVYKFDGLESTREIDTVFERLSSR